MLFPTTIVGSFPQPEWLIDRAKLAGRFPPRTRAKELWRIPPQYLEQAQDDATLIAIRAQEAAGLDIVSDGEIRRESVGAAHRGTRCRASKAPAANVAPRTTAHANRVTALIRTTAGVRAAFRAGS